MARYHLTFDIDWAPDWSVRETLAELDAFDTKATFFVTHDTPVLAEIRERGHTIGIHPNFMIGSTQGATPVEIVGNLLAFCPDAEASRAHGLHLGSVILHRVMTEFPQLKYELSTLMYRFPHVSWFDWRMSGVHFKRINYTWEDDLAFDDEELDWSRFEPWADLMIFDFHPIHISLNSHADGDYLALKESLGGSPLNLVDETRARGFESTGPGARDYLRAVLASSAESMTFEELVQCG